MRIIAALDDDDQALVMYEVTIGPSVTVTCAEHLTSATARSRPTG
jgi:hypothetical protein